MKTPARLLQRLVPAENRGCEDASAELVNSPIPADEQAGSPAQLEFPACLEALAAALEADGLHTRDLMSRAWRDNDIELWGILAGEFRATLKALDSVRSRAAAGGNDKMSH